MSSDGKEEEEKKKKEKKQEEKIRKEIRKEGDAVEPRDKEALRKIRERTRHSEGNGGKKKKGK